MKSIPRQNLLSHISATKRPIHNIPASTRALTTSRLLQSKQNRLQASYYRGGTSRAIILSQATLPAERHQWAPIFLSIIGGNDPNGRQLDGMGGGISSLSKVCVVGPSSHPGADVDYTFAAVGVRDSQVDFSSNCGNMTSAIGPYAVDRGLVEVREGDDVALVRIHNVNTGKIVHARFPVEGGEAGVEGDFVVDGVAGSAARIDLAFLDPAGSKTGKLLPTGNIVDVLCGVPATCIDAGNPCVFLTASSLAIDGTLLPEEAESQLFLLEKLEEIRRQASVAMGLSPTAESTPGSIPKIAIVSPPTSHKILSGSILEAGEMDLVVRAVSVGQPHRAVPITVAMAIAAAANLKGSTVESCVSRDRVDPAGLILGHSSGKLMVGAEFDDEGLLKTATVFRTARRLMEGTVFWK